MPSRQPPPHARRGARLIALRRRFTWRSGVERERHGRQRRQRTRAPDAVHQPAGRIRSLRDPAPNLIVAKRHASARARVVDERGARADSDPPPRAPHPPAPLEILAVHEQLFAHRTDPGHRGRSDHHRRPRHPAHVQLVASGQVAAGEHLPPHANRQQPVQAREPEQRAAHRRQRSGPAPPSDRRCRPGRGSRSRVRDSNPSMRRDVAARRGARGRPDSAIANSGPEHSRQPRSRPPRTRGSRPSRRSARRGAHYAGSRRCRRATHCRQRSARRNRYRARNESSAGSPGGPRPSCRARPQSTAPVASSVARRSSGATNVLGEIVEQVDLERHRTALQIRNHRVYAPF